MGKLAREMVAHSGAWGARMLLRNVVFLIVDGEYTFCLPHYIPDAELEPFKAAAFKIGPDEQLALLGADFSCAPYGFWWKVYPPVTGQPTTPLGEVHYPCVGFSEWLATLSDGLPRQQATTGTGRLALACFERFQSWAKPERARQAIELVEAGHATFESLREDLPEVFEVQAFKDYLAGRMATGSMPKARRGKRRNIVQLAAKRELYVLACRIEREEQPITWIAACAAACARRPDLVPKTWIESPADTLRREADSYFNKTRWGAYRLQNAPPF
ncbi:hypothetical protein ACP87_07235 [Pseudomonas oleovorans]|nr:hypothetical protein [Pseudomonas oleovorans]MBN7131281.1 hypothetical protein [Pseudomonas oleovorans]MBN7140717.1 hypothetical protein [Pseudomonas oleovorans]